MDRLIYYFRVLFFSPLMIMIAAGVGAILAMISKVSEIIR